MNHNTLLLLQVKIVLVIQGKKQPSKTVKSREKLWEGPFATKKNAFHWLKITVWLNTRTIL